MHSIAYTMTEYSTVIAMPGVGNALAPQLIAEIGDVRRFTSAKALNAYAGNDAPPYQLVLLRELNVIYPNVALLN